MHGTTETNYLIAGIYGAPIPNRMDINFKENANYSNFCRAEIRAIGDTDIGEKVSAYSVADTRCGIGNLSYEQLLDFVSRFLRANEYPAEPYKWGALSTKKSAGIRIAANEKRSEDGKALVALRKWFLGGKLTADDVNRITHVATEGSHLPTLPKRPDRKLQSRPSYGGDRIAVTVR